MARKKSNPHMGSAFEEFLAEEGRLQESTTLAIKRVLAWQIARAMKETKVSQAELARRMKTSRAVVHRLLDATDASVTLSTISKAATALGAAYGSGWRHKAGPGFGVSAGGLVGNGRDGSRCQRADSAVMNKISSNSTGFYKRVFPAMWFGFIAVFVGVALLSGAAPHGRGVRLR
jgi:antitoxin HicB